MIRILTDSACDILPAEAQQLGVTVIPLNVTLEDGTVLRDGIDMTPSEYYTHLAACRKLPTTSQPSPEQFERLYLDAAAAGDEVLGIFLSDALSGTGQCAIAGGSRGGGRARGTVGASGLLFTLLAAGGQAGHQDDGHAGQGDSALLFHCEPFELE
jgi:fatty acid-binding protein DegV